MTFTTYYFGKIKSAVNKYQFALLMMTLVALIIWSFNWITPAYLTFEQQIFQIEQCKHKGGSPYLKKSLGGDVRTVRCDVIMAD